MATGDPCDVCGRPIPKGSGPRKRCSAACRRAAANARQRRFYAADPDRAKRYQQDYKVRNIDAYRATLANRPRRSYEYQRANLLSVRYGLTINQYDAMVEAQAGLCAICRRPETRTNRGRPLPLSVDHDHETGAVRGLLCARCNSILGFFEEVGLFNAAVEYLRRHSSAKEQAR